MAIQYGYFDKVSEYHVSDVEPDFNEVSQAIMLDGALTSAEIELLAKGFDPRLILDNKLVWYVPLHRIDAEKEG